MGIPTYSGPVNGVLGRRVLHARLEAMALLGPFRASMYASMVRIASRRQSSDAAAQTALSSPSGFSHTVTTVRSLRSMFLSTVMLPPPDQQNGQWG